MTRSGILAAVRTYLERPDMPDTDLLLLMSMVEGELNRALRDHPRSQRRATFTQSAGNDTLSLPTDLAQIVTLRSGTNTVWSMFAPTQWASAQDQGRNGGFVYTAHGDCLELFPTPAEDTQFRLDYMAFLHPLGDDVDTNWVSTYFPDLYVYGMLKESAVYLRDDARLVGWQAEFSRRLDGVLAQGWGSLLGAAPRVRLA